MNQGLKREESQENTVAKTAIAFQVERLQIKKAQGPKFLSVYKAEMKLILWSEMNKETNRTRWGFH